MVDSEKSAMVVDIDKLIARVDAHLEHLKALRKRLAEGDTDGMQKFIDEEEVTE